MPKPPPIDTPAQQISYWADLLRDISANGLRFSRDHYDKINYEKVQTIALEMLAMARGESLERIEPLRAPVFSRPAPIPTVDAAIINEVGDILLIKRADNDLWAMPGGATEVGETPAHGAMREAFEETGVRCEVVDFVGVFDSRLCGSVSYHHLYQFVFLCRPLPILDGGAVPSHVNEVVGVGWFPEAALPKHLDPGHLTRIPHAFARWRGEQTTFVDKLSYDPVKFVAD